MFVKHSLDGKTTLFIVYVNDIIIRESDNKGIDKMKAFLQTKFQTKDLGVLKYFLSIEVMYSKKEIGGKINTMWDSYGV